MSLLILLLTIYISPPVTVKLSFHMIIKCLNLRIYFNCNQLIIKLRHPPADCRSDNDMGFLKQINLHILWNWNFSLTQYHGSFANWSLSNSKFLIFISQSSMKYFGDFKHIAQLRNRLKILKLWNSSERDLKIKRSISVSSILQCLSWIITVNEIFENFILDRRRTQSINSKFVGN